MIMHQLKKLVMDIIMDHRMVEADSVDHMVDHTVVDLVDHTVDMVDTDTVGYGPT